MMHRLYQVSILVIMGLLEIRPAKVLIDFIQVIFFRCFNAGLVLNILSVALPIGSPAFYSVQRSISTEDRVSWTHVTLFSKTPVCLSLTYTPISLSVFSSYLSIILFSCVKTLIDLSHCFRLICLLAVTLCIYLKEFRQKQRK